MSGSANNTLIGLDLGTTYSLAAYLKDGIIPSLIPDRVDANDFRTRSILSFNGNDCLVGRPVELMLEQEPDLPVIEYVKNSMGTSDVLARTKDGQPLLPEALSALILRKLKKDVSFFLAEDAPHALITIPAHFDDRQRKATLSAARLAGLQVVGLLEEPVAAAAFYGAANNSHGSTILVYDFGGGTFDATIVRSEPGILKVLATSGRTNLGGRELDLSLAQLLARSLGEEGLSATYTLRREAEKLKIAFSQPGLNQFRAAFLHRGQPHEIKFLRPHIEAVLRPICMQTLEVAGECLGTSGLKWNEIDEILLVGGSSQIPILRDLLTSVAGVEDERIKARQSHQAVAYGAARLAGSLDSGEMQAGGLVLERSAPYAVGIRTRSSQTGEMRIREILAVGTPLPGRVKSIFYTTRIDQKRLVFDMVQVGADGRGRSLGHFIFGPLPPLAKGTPVELELSYTRDGTVMAHARLAETGLSVSHTIVRDEESISDITTQQKALESILLPN